MCWCTPSALLAFVPQGTAAGRAELCGSCVNTLLLFLLAELQLLDPHENWAFLSWLLDERRLQFVEKVRLHTAPDIRAVFCFLRSGLVDMLRDRLKFLHSCMQLKPFFLV